MLGSLVTTWWPPPVSANRPRYSVESRRYSVEFTLRRTRTAGPSRLIRSGLRTIMVHHGAKRPPHCRGGDTSAGAQTARLGVLRTCGLRRARQDRRRKARLARLGGPGRGSGLHLPPGPPLPAAPAHPARPETPGMNLAAPARFQIHGGVMFCRTGPGECAS